MKKSNFLEGTVIATLAIIITKIMGMLYVIPFYSLVGEKGSELYAYAYNIYIIFLDISTAGIPIAMSKIIKEYSTLNMQDAKVRAYKIGKKIINIISIIIFLILFIFAEFIASFIIGDLQGGNSISDVAFVIRFVSFAILVVPILSISRGYLQGHNIINVSSISQIIEQIVRILIMLGGSFLALKVFNLSIKTTIGIAVFGACAGGIVAIFYVLNKISKNKEILGLKKNYKKDSITNKEIVKKIIYYAIPFIIIAIAASINNFADMVMILNTLDFLKMDASKVEFATTAITTWSPKISMIINSIAIGMTTSLIPTIVGAYAKKDYKEVNNKFNKAIELILVTSIPMCIGISLLSDGIWTIFYGTNKTGSMILSVQIFVSLFFNIYTITNSTLQGLNKFKTVYLSAILGFTTNIICNIPFMILFNYLGLPPYIGAIISTATGYFVSIIISFMKLKKDHKLKYTEIFKTLKDILIPTVCMIVIVEILKSFLKVSLASKISCTFYVGIISIIGGLTYLFVAYKTKLLERVIGKNYLQKIIKKLTCHKVSNN